MGPAKTLALLGPPQSRTYVQQQQHDAAGTDAFLAFPRIGCVKVCVRTEKRVKPNKKKKRRGAKSCQTGEEWREMSWYSRNAERRGGKGKERKWGKRGMTAQEGTAHQHSLFIHMHPSLKTTSSVFSKTRVQSEPDGCLEPQQHNNVFKRDNGRVPSQHLLITLLSGFSLPDIWMTTAIVQGVCLCSPFFFFFAETLPVF